MRQQTRVVGKHFRVVATYRTQAGSRRGDQVIEVPECLEYLKRQLPGMAVVAAVERRLPAAGSRCRHFDPTAGLLEQLDRGKAHGWPKQVDEAGDKEPYMRRVA